MKDRLVQILTQRGYKVEERFIYGRPVIKITKDDRAWTLSDFEVSSEKNFRSYVDFSMSVNVDSKTKADDEFYNSCSAVFRKERIETILKNVQ